MTRNSERENSTFHEATLLVQINKNNKLGWLQQKHKQFAIIIFIIFVRLKGFIRYHDSDSVGLKTDDILFIFGDTIEATMKAANHPDKKTDLETKVNSSVMNSNIESGTYKCLNYSYTNGKWEHYIKASGKTDYYWKTTSLNCQLEPWSIESFCTVLGKRSILMVGDSVTGNLYRAFALFHGVSVTSQIHQSLPDGRNPPVHETTSICNNNVVVTWVRNDWLTVNEPLTWNRTKNNMWGPWWHLLRYHDVLILNTGAHARPIADYQKNLIKVKNYLIQNSFKGKVIFRTTPRGHINCSKHDKHPIQLNDHDYNRFFRSIPEGASYKYLRYSYGMFEKYNNIMKELVQDTAFEVIDLAPIMELRPDIHKNPPTDCLHFATDRMSALNIWMILLQNSLNGNLR